MNKKLYTVFLAFLMLFITFSLIIFPENSLHASLRGLKTWWEIVFPSLLPFFITAELLIRFGVVQFIGVLFEPIMRPLFNVPGVGSFAWIVGMASGYPTGAKITVMLREKEQITQHEAERLVSFSNASSPLFIFGAIAVGFLHRPELGILIALSHYIGNVFVGLCMRFYQKSKHQKITIPKQNNMIHRAFQKMHRTRIQKEQPIGQIIGDSVLTSVQTLLMIGGFIILFSVFTSILQVIKITDILSFLLLPFFHLLQMPVSVVPALFTGIFEITMGADSLTSIGGISLSTQLIILSFMLGFNGFSIQAQVASILAETDIRFFPYFLGRVLHACFASVICYFLYTFLFESLYTFQMTLPVFMQEAHHSILWIYQWSHFGPIITIVSLFAATCILWTKWKNQRTAS